MLKGDEYITSAQEQFLRWAPKVVTSANQHFQLKKIANLSLLNAAKMKICDWYKI